MIRIPRAYLKRFAIAIALLGLALFVARASASPTHNLRTGRTADRGGIYNTGGFTFGNTQQLTYPANPVFFAQNAEPEIKTDISGNIYATAINGVPGGTNLWKSTDKGTSFAYLGQPDGSQDHCATVMACGALGAGGGDDSIDVSNGGYLYVSSLWLGSVTASTSTDGGTGGAVPGQAWTVDPAAATVPGDDRQWLVAYGPRTVYMSYTNIGTGQIFVEKSTNGGKTFSGAVAMYPATSSILSDLQGNMAVDQYNGNVYGVFIPVGAHNQIYLARSTDGGATWTLHQAYVGPSGTDNGQVFPSMAVDRGGNIHIAFSRCVVPAHTSCQIYMVSSAPSSPSANDAGDTWTDVVRVSNGPDTVSAVEPTVAAGGDGVVDITWLGSTTTSPDIAGDWHVFFAQTRDALSAAPTFNQVQATGVMHQKVICFNGLACAAGTRDLLEYYSMAIDPDGNANIAFTDTKNNCPAASCTSNAWYTKQATGPSAFAPPASPAASTFLPSLALPSSNGDAEPSLWVDTHDCIYASAPGAPHAWASTNGGTSFNNPTIPVTLPNAGGDEDVLTVPQASGARPDNVYYADLGISNVNIAKSTNNGATWTMPGAAAVVSPSSDRQWLTYDRFGGNQYLYLTDHEFSSEVVRMWASTNDGAWAGTSEMTDPELIGGFNANTNPGPSFVDHTTHAVDSVFDASTNAESAIDAPFGKLLNVWFATAPAPAAPNGPPGTFANTPVFEGLYSSASAPAPPAGTATYGSNVANIFPAGDIDSAGNIYLAWGMNNTRTNEFSIWFAASHDHGQSFYGPFQVSRGPGTAVFPWVAAGDAGRVDIVWYQTDTVGDPNTLPLNPASASNWNVMFGQSLNASSRSPVFAVTQAGDHIIHHGRISTGGLLGSSDRSLLDYFEVSIDPAGKANMVYADNGSSGLHVDFQKQNAGPVVRTQPTTPTCTQPTAVTLASFGAHVAGHTVHVAWKTRSEVETLGFNVWRKTAGRHYARLNSGLLYAKGAAGVIGRSYAYTDRRVQAGATYSYKLEIVRKDGTSRWAGPVAATARR